MRIISLVLLLLLIFSASALAQGSKVRAVEPVRVMLVTEDAGNSGPSHDFHEIIREELTKGGAVAMSRGRDFDIYLAVMPNIVKGEQVGFVGVALIRHLSSKRYRIAIKTEPTLEGAARKLAPMIGDFIAPREK